MINRHYLRIVLYCIIDIFIPFFSFFIFFDHHWPFIVTHTAIDSKGWFVVPTAILLLVAIVFCYMISVQFPVDRKQAWKLLRAVFISLALLLLSSGTAWQSGLFQYGLLELAALSAAFGLVLPRQQPKIIGWLFGLPALVWAVIAIWTSYKLYVATFLISMDWFVWVLWPVWMLAAVPLLKNRYMLMNGFFKEYKKNHS